MDYANKGFLGFGGKETLRYDNSNLYNKDGSAYTGKVKGFLAKSAATSTKILNKALRYIEVQDQENLWVKDL